MKITCTVCGNAREREGCSHCGEVDPLPEDYEACGDCGYDHDYEPQLAAEWHRRHPCSYCQYDKTTKTHQPQCPTQTSEQKYVNDVVSWLPRIPNQRDFPEIVEDIKRLRLEGFTPQDAASYTRLTEEVNPQVSEDYAIKRMGQIRNKYKRVQS